MIAIALPDRIAAVIAEQLNGADLAGVTLLGSGIATNAYQVDASTGSWVVRISRDYPHPWRWRGGRRYEVALLLELAARGLPVPRDPFAIRAADGLPVAIVERKVAGAPLSHVSPDNARLAIRLGNFLTRLHRFPVDTARVFGVPVVEHGAECRKLLGDAAPFLTNRLYQYLDSQIADVEDCHPSALVHGDVRAEHLYLDTNGELVGVIDFGDVAISDPAYDFAKVTTELGAGFAASLLEEYRNPIDPSFRARIGIYSKLELLWEIARPDAIEQDRTAALERLESSCDN